MSHVPLILKIGRACARTASGRN